MRFGGAEAAGELDALGMFAGSIESEELSRQAEKFPPQLRTHDRYGNRINLVEYHPAYHRFMTESIEAGAHGWAFADKRDAAHVIRAAKLYIQSQAEPGHVCPISMTYAIVPALRANPELAAFWEPKLASRVYDPRAVAPQEKAGATAGMAMTEKQGGSDVRANTTFATQAGGGMWELKGHKWFCSAPMGDIFLTLAHTDAGLTCFAVQRWLEDGSANPFRIVRLKDKLGNRSNASSEVEYDGTMAQMVGEPGRGIPAIIEMVNHTRLDCVVGSAAGYRWGAAEALHHARHRSTFGQKLVDHDLMRAVLADLILDSEAATVTAFRLAAAYDTDEEAPLRRLATAVSKYWICKRLPSHAVEALECLGGNGYVEESGLPRHFRESPLASIWEGSGNVMCLDVLRALAKEPETWDAFVEEIRPAAEEFPEIEAKLAPVRGHLTDLWGAVRVARRLVEDMALAFQASCLVQYGREATAEQFVKARLTSDHGHAYGTADVDPALIDGFLPA